MQIYNLKIKDETLFFRITISYIVEVLYSFY